MKPDLPKGLTPDLTGKSKKAESGKVSGNNEKNTLQIHARAGPASTGPVSCWQVSRVVEVDGLMHQRGLHVIST